MAEPPIEMRFCVNCKKDINSTNYQMHEIHCKRFMILCEKCDEAVPKDLIDDHDNEFHAEVQCDQCHKKISKDSLLQHQKEDCTHRLLLCEYCDLDYPEHEFKHHQDDCGSRTDNCELCSATVLLRNMKKHLSSSCSRYSTKSENTNRSMGNTSMYQNEPTRQGFSRQPLLPKVPNAQAYEARIRGDKGSSQDFVVHDTLDKQNVYQSSYARTSRTSASSQPQDRQRPQMNASTGQKKQTSYKASNNLQHQRSSYRSSFSDQVNAETKKFPAAANSLNRLSQNKQLSKPAHNQFPSSGLYKDEHVREESSSLSDRDSLLNVRGDQLQSLPRHSHSPRQENFSRDHGDYFSRDSNSSHGKYSPRGKSSSRGRGDNSSRGRGDNFSRGRGDNSSRGRGVSSSRGHNSSRGRGHSPSQGHGGGSRGHGNSSFHRHGGSSHREYKDALSHGRGGGNSTGHGNSSSCSDDDPAFVPCEFCDNLMELKELERHQAICDKNYITQFNKTTLQSRYRTPSPEFQRSVNSGAADTVPCEYCGTQISFEELFVHESACYLNDPANSAYEEGSLMHQFEFTSSANEMMCENCKQRFSSPDELFAHQIECLETFDHPTLSNIKPRVTRNCFSPRRGPERQEDIQPTVSFPEDDDLLPCEFCHDSFPAAALVQHQYTCEENNVTGIRR